MLKKVIKYTDYNGEEREEPFYFNLSKVELTDLELTTVGGFEQFIQKIVATKDTVQLVKLFKEIIFKAYGEKSPDGKRFIKSEELSTAFTQTEAYTELYMELISNEQAAVDFIQGIIPKLPEDHK